MGTPPPKIALSMNGALLSHLGHRQNPRGRSPALRDHGHHTPWSPMQRPGRPYRRILSFLTALTIVTLVFLGFRLQYLPTSFHGKQKQPELKVLPPPPSNDGPRRSEYYQWETASYFNPVRQDVEGKTTEKVCESFPTHLLESIQPVLKLGHGDKKEKVDSQLQTVSACLDNLLIFSDLDEKIGNRTTYDLLADLPVSYQIDNPDFLNYTYMKELRNTGTLDVNKEATATINGWILDKYKFLPMVERAWAMRPHRRFYVFYETDTYIVWDNMFRLLENLDPDTPLYLGSPSPGRIDPKTEEKTWFSNGGPGFVLSRAAVMKLLYRKVGEDGDYLEAPLSHRWLDILRHECCGDSVLGWALHNRGVEMSGLWPMFNPHPAHGVPFADLYWCQPILTFHKTSPKDMVDLWRWEHSRRQAGRPLLYSDLYEWKRPGRPATRDDWENSDWDGWDGPEVDSSGACAKACEDEPQCFQWNWHMNKCRFVRCIRQGAHRDEEEGGAFTSGWITPKIDAWRAERQCEVVQWVRPSTTRIF